MSGVVLSCDGDIDCRGLMQALTQRGVQFCAPETQNAATAAVVVFERITERLYDDIVSLALRIKGRVVAVATSDEGIRGDGYRRLIELGASDVVLWNDPDRLADQVAARLCRWTQVDHLVCAPFIKNRVVGNSAAWRLTLRQLVEAARFSDEAILVTGETGTGKELAARMIHAVDARRSQRELGIVDCAAIVPGLSGSEFFGHERGAFTGASSRRDGAFARADRGVLFLDEVGELPLDLQVQLLRVLQEKRYKRVGGNTWQNTDFRLVCATNRDLPKEIEAGRFRRDLYYRLAGWTVTLPPLSHRRDDILPLATHLLKGADPTAPELDIAVQQHLINRRYPGNIRDLQQLCLRMRARHVGAGPYTLGDLPPDEFDPVNGNVDDWRQGELENAVRKAMALGIGLKDISSGAAEMAIDVAMAEHNGSTTKVARQLKVTPRALQLRKRKKGDV